MDHFLLKMIRKKKPIFWSSGRKMCRKASVLEGKGRNMYKIKRTEVSVGLKCFFKGTFGIYNMIIGIYMSSFIDDLIFYKGKSPEGDIGGIQPSENEETLGSLSKQLSLNQGAFLVTANPQIYDYSNKVKIQEHEYCIRVRIKQSERSVRVEAKLLRDSLFRKVGSKHNEILFLKEIARRQYMNARESTFYVNRGKVVMVQHIRFTLIEKVKRQRVTDFYNVAFSRNLNEFYHFMNRHFDKEGNFSIGEQEGRMKLEKDLMLSQVLGTTTNTFDVSEESSQFKQIEASMQKKLQEVKTIKRNIVDNMPMERLVEEIYERIGVTAKGSWIKNNFEDAYTSNEKRFGGLLAVSKFAGEKKIDDYIFNVVKVVLKEQMAKPFSEGGSCQLFIAKADITFISSLDSTAYFQNKDKREKIIAVKKLKPEFEKKFIHKLEHQKNLVAKLKGGCSYFIPKYYRQESSMDKGDTLMMEYIQGEELDFYTMSRQETMSLWTKLYILLNVVHGLRYLSNYGIVHLDLKPINIIVCRHLITKIIDYGEAYHRDLCDEAYSPGYTFPYVAPEVYLRFEKDQTKKQDFQFTQKQDVFGFGLIMLQILFNAKVFQFTQNKFKEVYSRKQVLDRLFFGSQRLQYFGDNMIGTCLAYMIIRCLDPDPGRRPKFDWIAVSLKLIINSCTGGS